MLNCKPITSSILILQFLMILSSGTVLAQDAFEKVHISASAHQVMTGNTIFNSWSPSTGLGVELSTPYYTGFLEGGYRYIRYNELDFAGSGFHSHYLFVGWQKRLFQFQDFSLKSGFRLGNRFMLHDEDMIYGNETVFSREESEFSYELLFRAEKILNEHLTLYISTSYNRTLFYIPYSALYGTAGISFSIQSPGWLKQMMK